MRIRPSASISKHGNHILTIINIPKIEAMSEEKSLHGEIILYQPDETTKIQVMMEEDTVWLNRHQLSILFGRDVKTIGKHINNALKEELSSQAVVAKFATTATDGKIYKVEYYNLDMILSIGYRVKSDKGVKFRQWANKVLKDYLLTGYAINKRIENIEKRVSVTEEKVDFFVRSSLPPVQGLFYDGQIFDAYVTITNLIKQAKKEIILIDNYIDETVLMMLDKRKKNVTATIYTRPLNNSQKLDLRKHNEQYPHIEVKECNKIHDRFVIIDNDVYLFGASIKDAGKKLFAYIKISTVSAPELIQNIK